MTAGPSIDLPAWMTEQLSQASPDLLRQMVQTFAEALMSADADGIVEVRADQLAPKLSRCWSLRWRGGSTQATRRRPMSLCGLGCG